MKALIDTDVCIDLLTMRAPHGPSAQRLFTLVSAGRFDAYATPTTFVHVHYVLRKYAGARALRLLAEFRGLVRVIAVDEQAIDRALTASWPDFEDAVQAAAAVVGSMDAIVTRNARDYRRSQLPVVSPAELVAKLDLD